MGRTRRTQTNPDPVLGREARDHTPNIPAVPTRAASDKAAQSGGAPCLEIYIMSHCENCRYALEMADWIAQHYPQVQLRVINLETTTEQIPESVFATPTYLLNGRVWSLGNPSHEQVTRTLEPLTR